MNACTKVSTPSDITTPEYPYLPNLSDLPPGGEFLQIMRKTSAPVLLEGDKAIIDVRPTAKRPKEGGIYRVTFEGSTQEDVAQLIQEDGHWYLDCLMLRSHIAGSFLAHGAVIDPATSGLPRRGPFTLDEVQDLITGRVIGRYQSDFFIGPDLPGYNAGKHASGSYIRGDGLSGIGINKGDLFTYNPRTPGWQDDGLYVVFTTIGDDASRNIVAMAAKVTGIRTRAGTLRKEIRISHTGGRGFLHDPCSNVYTPYKIDGIIHSEPGFSIYPAKDDETDIQQAAE
jgi:hypothetical protein